MRALWFALAAGTAILAQPPVGSRPFRLEELKTPPGFEVSVYARVAGGPRLMTVGPNGALYVAAGGTVWAVPAAGQVVSVVSGLNGAHSVQFQGNDLCVAVADGVLRFRDAVTPAERVLDLPVGGQHSTRTAYFGPDGSLYESAGSTCNFCVESDSRRATIMRGDTVFATGLRNSVGFAWHPATGDLWATDNGGDGLGDNVPPDEINIIKAGARLRLARLLRQRDS